MINQILRDSNLGFDWVTEGWKEWEVENHISLEEATKLADEQISYYRTP